MKISRLLWIGSALAVAVSANASPVSTVRVLIFPHIQTYTSPEGRESVLDRVTLSSPSACEVDGENRSALGSWTQTFIASAISHAIHLHCSNPVTVIRESHLESFIYAGDFEISVNKGILQVVNIVSLETYIDGVVPTEMPSNWPTEALKAQAIAARSFAVFQILSARDQIPDRGYDLDDTIFYQAYLGLTRVVSESHQAVTDTAGLVLLNHGKVIKAYFHADSGGHTEDANQVFLDEADSVCVGKKELFSPSQISGDGWGKIFSYPELTSLLVSAQLIPTDAAVTHLLVASTNASGRALLFQVESTHGDITLNGLAVRFALGLRSLLITSMIQGKDSMKIEGRGSGHGVGMNQSGARFLATRRSLAAPDILRFYYTGVEIGPLP